MLPITISSEQRSQSVTLYSCRSLIARVSFIAFNHVCFITISQGLQEKTTILSENKNEIVTVHPPPHRFVLLTFHAHILGI